MAGYVRQSVASIINGENITAPPLNAEFNQLAASFDAASGHVHDGTTGNGPKIPLATSVTGYLQSINGGTGGLNNYTALRDPINYDDVNDGYAVGSVWYNVPDDKFWICAYNAANTSVWREVVFYAANGNLVVDDVVINNDISVLGASSLTTLSVSSTTALNSLTASGNTTLSGNLTVGGTTFLNGDVDLGNASTDTITFTGRMDSSILPITDDLYDLGSSTREWRNLYIDGSANIDTLNADTAVITSGDFNSGVIDNTIIGATTPEAATFTTVNVTTSITASSADINSGTIDNTAIGASIPNTGAFTTLSSSGLATLASVNIDGGAIDGTTIGANSHTTGKFTTLQSTGLATLATADINGGTIDGAAIGSTTRSSGAFTTLAASGGITGSLTGNVAGNVTGNVTGDVTGNVVGDVTGNITAASGTSSFNNVTINGTLNMNAATTATIINLTDPVNAQDAATKNYVDTSVANLVDAAPGTLDTLNELAAALGDDPNFSTTISNTIATKLPLAGGTMTGPIAMSSNGISGMADPSAAQDAATKNYVDTQDALQVSRSGDSMSGNLAMGSNNITGLAAPTASDHATNKSYVDGILGSATAASASAAAAATSENNAATSASAAFTSASNAASSATAAADTLDAFDDRYLGSKSAAPTVDNDGDPLIIGALYFNTTTDIMYVYGSGGWVPAGSSVNGTSERQSYVATAGQTIFSATYDAGYVDVYLNGIRLVDGSDFTATTGTYITLASGATAGDVVEILAFGTFALADHYNKTDADARFINETGDSMSGDLSFGDNNKATFGDGSDLQIYHDGSNSFIADVGTGNLKVRGEDLRLEDTSGNRYLQGVSGGATTLYYAGSALVNTTAGGLDINGTVTADGLTVDGTSSLNGDITMNTGTPELRMYSPTSVNGYVLLSNVSDTVDGGLSIKDVSGNVLANFRSNGDISFYDSLGSSQKFFWDASAEALGLGTTVPSGDLDIYRDTTDPDIRLTRGTTQSRIATTSAGGLRLQADYGNTAADSFIQLSVDGSEAMRINSSGNVGIGTSSPASALDVVGNISQNGAGDSHAVNFGGSTSAAAKFTRTDGGHWVDVVIQSPTTTGNSRLFFSDGVSSGAIDYEHADDSMRFNTNSTEAMRINASGQVGIGTDPWAALTVPSPTYISGVFKKSHAWGSLNTTGVDIARLYSGGNGQSAWFKFHLVWGNGGYREITYACYNGGGTWYPTKKDVYTGNSGLDVVSSGNGATVIFTIKSTSGTQSYTPRVIVEAFGNSIDSNYFL